MGQFSTKPGSEGVNCDDVSVISRETGSVIDNDIASISDPSDGHQELSFNSDTQDGLSGYSDDTTYTDSDNNIAHGYSDMAQENSDNNMAHGDDIIVIDSGDDDEPSNAIELSYVITKTQTFMFTITRKIKFLNGNIVDVDTHLQNDYYEQI